MLKKALLLVGLLSGSAFGFSNQYYIQNSTSPQLGAIDISSFTAHVSTMTNVTLGVSSMTTTLPMSGRKITGLADGSSANDAVTFEQFKFVQCVSSITAAGASVKSTTSSTAVSTFLAATITPKYATSHLLAYVSGGLEATNSNTNARLYISSPNAGSPGTRIAVLHPSASANTRVPASGVYDDGVVGRTTAYTLTVELDSSDNTNSVSFPTSGGEQASMVVCEVVMP